MLLPQDIWDQITGGMSSLSAIHSAAVFDYQLNSERAVHGNIWASIFKVDTWASEASEKGIDVVLVGSHLPTIHEEPSIREHAQNFVVLHVRSQGRLDNNLDQRLFFDCLRVHKYNPSTEEVRFASG